MKNKQSVHQFIRACFLYTFSISGFLYAQATSPQFSLEPSIQWNRMELVSTTSLDLTAVGLKLPTGRAHGEELLDIEFPQIIAPYLFSVPIDSSSTVETAVQKGIISILDLDSLVSGAKKTPAVLDLEKNRLNRTYTLPLNNLVALLVHHHTLASLPRPLIPLQSQDYTGLVIFAQDPLPIHGRQSTALLVPCLFPKIWDSEMNLIYERNVVDPDIAKTRGIVQYTSADRVLLTSPSGIGPELQSLIGTRPLRILADRVFGRLPTDPVISTADAQRLLSSDNNRRLLAEGRVLIVIAPQLLLQKLTVAEPSTP